MKNIYKILMIGIVAILLSSAIAVAPGIRGGHTPGFWKKHLDAWACSGLAPSDPLTDVFNIPYTGVGEKFEDLDGATLLDALNFKGGKGDVGMARNLLKQAVAAVLNQETRPCHPSWRYPFWQIYGITIVNAVNNALMGSRQDMEDLKDKFDNLNNLGVPDDWFK